MNYILFRILVDGTAYENVPYEEINRPRYQHLKEKLTQYKIDLTEAMFYDK